MFYKHFNFKIPRDRPICDIKSRHHIKYTSPYKVIVFLIRDHVLQDLAVKTANENGSTLILANDPDADRLGVAEKQSKYVDVHICLFISRFTTPGNYICFVFHVSL